MYGDGEGTVWDLVGRPHRDCMCYLGPPTNLMPIGMRKSPEVSPRRLSDISPQLRQLKYLVVDEAIKEDLKSSRSVEDINSASIEERILRITGYYGYQPWSASYKREDRPREHAAHGGQDAQSAAGATGPESGSNKRRLHCCIRITAVQVRKALWGVAMVMCVCSSWAGSTQLAKLTFKHFDGPFTLTWFATTWNCLFFPLYYIGHLCKSPERQTARQRLRECCRFFGDDGLNPKVFFTKVAPFGLLWILTNYLYLQALRKINTTDASALFCCNKAFVFLLSWIVLRDRFMGVRVSSRITSAAGRQDDMFIVAAILAIAGIVMMTYADGFHSHSVIGITLVVTSASMSALYKVLFKMVLGSAKFGEAALFLTIVGGANFVCMSIVPVILYFTRVEYIGSIGDIPWGYLCGVAGLLLGMQKTSLTLWSTVLLSLLCTVSVADITVLLHTAFNVLVNFGIAITYPTLISLGIVLSVPVNAMVDLYTCEIHFNTVRLIAVSIICLGFLMLLLPEDWDQCIIQLSTRLRKRDEPTEGGVEAGAATGLNWRGRARTSMSTFVR
ncbi:putative thiamine transporter SLC35F3 isoform X2 [Dunckerocampus dactyliophorus]|uniref:putative thiamine transporter SLC35F3 isoform X2 n=1 Tax=Dunckerocampus dactyliophorus TaxID=161453 RepID=UPI002404E6CA|nr:putative thiamine transporter SLC35F3 isoform X2 [Dunckerocampus dactyliophorus]